MRDSEQQRGGVQRLAGTEGGDGEPDEHTERDGGVHQEGDEQRDKADAGSACGKGEE